MPEFTSRLSSTSQNHRLGRGNGEQVKEEARVALRKLRQALLEARMEDYRIS